MRLIVLILLLTSPFLGFSQTYHLQHGMNLFDEAKYDDSEELLKEEIKRHPTETRAYEYLGRVYDAKESYQLAIQQFDLAIKHTNKLDYKRLASLWKYKGQVYFRAELNNQALDCFNMALKLNPEEVSILVARAAIFQDMEQYQEAKKDCENALKIEALNFDVNAQYVFALFKLKDYDTALKYANILVTLQPKNDLALAIRGKIYENKGDIPLAINDAYESFRLKGSPQNRDQLVHLGDFDKGLALNKADLLVKEFPRRDLMLDLRARIYESNQDYLDAIADLSNALHLVQADKESYYFSRRGTLYDSMNFTELAVNDYTESINRDSSSAFDFERRGYQYMILGQVEKALNDFNKGIELDPEYEDLYHNRAFLHLYFTKNYQASLADYNRAYAINKYNSNNLMYRGRLYAQFLNMPDKALEDFKAVVSIDSVLGDSETFQYYGLLGLGLKEQAVNRVLTEVNKFKSNTAHYNAACVYALLGNAQKAIAHLDTSIRKGNWDIHFIKIEPDFHSIRSEEGFKRLIADLEAKLKPIKSKEFERQASTLTGKYAGGNFQIPIAPSSPGGTYEVKGSMNGLKVNMIFDTGASGLIISKVEEQFMLKNGYLKESDYSHETTFKIADGSLLECKVYILKDFELGGVHIQNVEISTVEKESADILMGQSVMSRFGKFEVDNTRNVVRFSGR